jgi:hypothetical protein
MPSYKLQHGSATGSVDCGNVVISQSGPNNTTKVMGNPPGGGAPQDITAQTTYVAASGSNGTIMNPKANDTINFGTYTVPIGTPPVSYGFSSNAAYRAPGNGQGGGYFTTGASPTAGLDDWDAADAGPDPKY